VVTITVTCY